MKKSIILLIALLPLTMCHGEEKREKEVVDEKAVRISRGDLYWLFNRACSSGDEVGVRILMAAGADINGHKDYEFFSKDGFGPEPSWPLNLASGGGHKEIVKLLLAKGAKVDNPEGDGGSYTALTFAVSNGHEEIVKILLEAGADTTIKCFYGTPIEIARKKKFSKIIKLLEAKQK